MGRGPQYFDSMGLIITPGPPMSDKSPFAALCDNPEQYESVAKKFMVILASSFETDRRRSGVESVGRIKTEAEIKRRAELIGKWFRIMRGDSGFTLQRTLDELPRALRAELDGKDYEPPPKNRLWTPGGVLS